MSETAKKPLVVFMYVVLVLSTMAVYWQVRNFDFVNYDDNDYVYENPDISNGLSYDSFIRAFTIPHVGNWLPLTWLSFILDCQLFGLNPGRMHVVNLLFHIANTLLLFTLLKKMTGSLWPSAFVAAAFALHPMHVESVAWITERKDVLSCFFLLLTLAAYTSYIKRPTAVRYIGTLALFELGLLAKPMLVTLPLLLLLLDYWPLGRIDTRGMLYRRIVEKTPFFVLSAISGAVTFFVQKGGGSVADVNIVDFPYRAANAFVSYAKYIGKLFWPYDLALFYPLDIRTIQLWQAAACALLLAGITIFMLCFCRTRKYMIVGWLWFIIALIPVIGLIQSGAQAMADRYTYISYTGLFILVAWVVPELLSKLPYGRSIIGISAAIALMAMGITSHKQASYWKDSFTLFSHAIEVTPNSYVAYNNRGDSYIKRGRLQEAMADFSRSIELRPDNAVAYNNRGFIYGQLGRWQEAMEAYDKAIEIDPAYADAYINMGVAYGTLGRWQEAMEVSTLALKVRPDRVKAYNNRGVSYHKLGRYQEAIEDYLRAIKLKPDYTEAYNNLGSAYCDLGQWQEAVEACQHAINIQPDYANAHYNLANGLRANGRLDEAVDHYRQALKLSPDWPDPMNSLALLMATNPGVRSRDTNEAVRLACRACELTSYKNPVFLGTLAAAYASAGKFSEAVDMAKKAINLADAAGQPQLGDIIRHHLSFYEQGKPYIEAGPKPLKDPSKP
jgi:tetratricopeptide (TPR) repeat protein